MKPTAKLVWPKNRPIAAFERSAETIRFLTQVSLLTMAASCVWDGGMEMVERLAEGEAVFDRVTMISITANSYHRLFSRDLVTLDSWNDHIHTIYPPRDNRPQIIREKVEGSGEDNEPAKTAMETWWKRGNHRDIQTRSVIDYNLWKKARWKGTLYASYGPDVPPVVGLIFTDRDAARAIFERWGERFGNVDIKDEIYLSIVRDVSDANPTHYNVLITSNVNLTDIRKPGGAMVLSRFNRMQPDTDTNLRRFLNDYDKARSYLLMPVVIDGGNPQLFSDIAILKQKIIIKSAKDVGPDDIEQCCLGEKANEHFAGTDVDMSFVPR
jgi:hypothetical protein